MQLQALTAAGFALLDFSIHPDPSATAVPPTVIEVDHHHVTITELPVALSEVAAAIGSPLWVHGGQLHTLPPTGPIGTDLGHPTGLVSTVSSDPVGVVRPVVFDFSADGHKFPGEVEATVTLLRGSRHVWDANLVPAEPGTPGIVTLSATALNAHLTVDTNGNPRIILPHPKGSLYDAAAIMSTLLLSIYLALVAGTRHDTDIANNGTKWLLLIVDGPLAALGAIIGAAETFETSSAWRSLRYASFVGICGAGAAVVVLLRFMHAERGPIEEWERRLIEPAIVVALQVPFVGRLGILVQMLAGLASSAIVTRDTPIINVTATKETIETVFRLAVILWLSPLLLNPAVMDAMETQQRRWTMAVGTAISVGVATLVSSATRIR